MTGALDGRDSLHGRLENPAEFENLIVADRNGQVIRLGQVATIRDATAEPRTLALYNGKEAIGIDIKKTKGYSTTDVATRVRDRLAQLSATLPKGTKIDIVKDAGVRVTNAVKNVEEALFLGALLTVLVVFLFLNSWRSTVITGVALPISVLASFIAVWALGFNLETMSLMGLSLAIGILIDDAIVVRENIVRHVEMGKDHFKAAHDGTDEIGLAVAATTFSILAVFIPIGFMPGVGGQWFKPFALTIASSVAVSLFVSFSLDPMLSAYWPDPHKEPHERGWITRQLDKFNAWFNKAQNYKKVIAWALDHRAAMVTMAVLTFVASFCPHRGVTGPARFRYRDHHLSNDETDKCLGQIAISMVAWRFVVLPQVVTPVCTVGTAFFLRTTALNSSWRCKHRQGRTSSTRDSRPRRPRAPRARCPKSRTRTRRLAMAGRAVWTRATSTSAQFRRTSDRDRSSSWRRRFAPR